MKTTWRYLLMVTMVLSVLGVKAQTPQYGNTYKPQERLYLSTGTHVMAEQPQAEMYSTSAMPTSGSTLPQAAVDGVSTADGSNNSGPHRAKKGWGGEGEPGDRPEPWETPLGDATWFLLALACAYLIISALMCARANVKE